MFWSPINRREFIKNAARGVTSLWALAPFAKFLNAAPVTLEPRQRIANPYVTNEGKPILVCVNGDDYTRMLQTGLAALGGLGLLVDNNQDVLIKPNFVYTEGYPTTSDVSAVVSTIEAVQQVSTGAVSVGDTGGIDPEQIYDFLHIEEAVMNAGGTLLLLDDTYDVRRQSWPNEMPDFKVWTDIYDTPILINLCALKRHYAAYMTCAIKHHVGAVAGPDRTYTRGYLHAFADRSYDFLTTLAEMAGVVNPELTIVDARQVMAINGPLRSYGGQIRDCGKLIICGDMVATDAYCARLLEQYDETFNASWVNTTLARAVELGLGTSDLDQVEIIELEQTSVGDGHINGLPSGVELHQNYPNPFNAKTQIVFNLPSEMPIRIDIYDINGRRVNTLVDGTYVGGKHNIRFDAGGLSSGTYFCHLKTPRATLKKVMVLVK